VVDETHQRTCELQAAHTELQAVMDERNQQIR
jgi:hypothetical protein